MTVVRARERGGMPPSSASDPQPHRETSAHQCAGEVNEWNFDTHPIPLQLCSQPHFKALFSAFLHPPGLLCSTPAAFSQRSCPAFHSGLPPASGPANPLPRFSSGLIPPLPGEIHSYLRFPLCTPRSVLHSEFILFCSHCTRNLYPPTLHFWP